MMAGAMTYRVFSTGATVLPLIGGVIRSGATLVSSPRASYLSIPSGSCPSVGNWTTMPPLTSPAAGMAIAPNFNVGDYLAFGGYDTAARSALSYSWYLPLALTGAWVTWSPSPSPAARGYAGFSFVDWGPSRTADGFMVCDGMGSSITTALADCWVLS